MRLDRQFKLNIAASVAASVLVVIFVQPLLTLLWSFLVWVSTYTWTGLVDSAYQNAALSNSNWVVALMFAIVVGGGLIALTLVLAAIELGYRVLALFANWKQMTMGADSAAADNKPEASAEQGPIAGESSEELDVAFAELREATSRFLRLLRPMRWLLITCALVIAVSALVLVTFAFVDVQLNASFQHRLAILGPVLTVAEEKTLRSKWALMRSRSDYLAIQNQLEEIARRHRVNLPELPLR